MREIAGGNLPPRYRAVSDDSRITGLSFPIHRARRGAATLEYVLLLAAVVGGVMLGTAVLGNASRDNLASLSRGMAAGDGSAESARGEVHSVGRASSTGHPSVELQVRTERRRTFALLGFQVLAFGLLVAAWFALRRTRRVRRPRPDEEDQEPQCGEVTLTARIADKRKGLWRGLIADYDLLRKNHIEVRHLMTRNPVLVSPGETRARLAALMAEHQVRHLLVCRTNGELLGVVSNRDIHEAAGKTARALMTANPVTVSPDTTISAATAKLLENGFSCLPVMDQGVVSGILTTTDLVLTLQCTLQLWLRLAQGQQGRAGSRPWDEMISSMQRNLGSQQVRLQKLDGKLRRTTAETAPGDESGFVCEARALLDTMAEMTDMAATARDRLQDEIAFVADGAIPAGPPG